MSDSQHLPKGVEEASSALRRSLHLPVTLDSGRRVVDKFDELGIPPGFLTDRHIRTALENDTLIARGTWTKECIRHASYTLRLGSRIEVASASKANQDARRDFAIQDLIDGEYFELKPGDTAKLYSNEILRLPHSVLGFTVARGLMFFEALVPENTYVDPGFDGNLYTTVTNLSHRVVRLRYNDPIARLFLYHLCEPVEEPYLQGAAKGLKQRLESERATKIGTPEECRNATTESLIKELAQLPTGGNQLAELSKRQRARWAGLFAFSAFWPSLLVLANLNNWVREKLGFAVSNLAAIGVASLISYFTPKLWTKLKRL